MFRRLSAAIQNAVETLSSPGTLFDDFLYHWKMILKFYGKKNAYRDAVETTNIPGHLDQLLEILVQEEYTQDTETPGACLEYFLYHKFLDLIVTFAACDSPPGMRQIVLIFVRRLVLKIKQPILPHVGILPSVMQLILMCDGRTGSPTELDEISFLCTLCAVISKNPHLLAMFSNQITTESQSTEETINTNGDETQRHRNIGKEENTQSVSASSLVMDSVNHTKADATGESTSCVGNDQTEVQNVNASLSKSSRNVLLDCLLSFMCTEDNRVKTKACEGIMVIASLSSDEHAFHVTQHSSLCKTLSSELKVLFEAIPQGIDPVELYSVKFNWGFDTPAWADGVPFPGCREITSFFAWLDYCNQLIHEAHKIVGDSICKSIRRHFLEKCTLLHIVHVDDIEKPGVIALLRKCLKVVTAPAFLQEFICWFFGSSEEMELTGIKVSPYMSFIDCCLHKSDEISLEALQLFQTLLEKPSQEIFNNLMLKYLASRSYCDSTASDSCASSWSDEEDERERLRETEGLSQSSSRASRTFAPRNVHKIINRFVFLIPRNMQTTNGEESSYEQYIDDVSKQYESWVSRCSQYKWPVEAVFSESHELDDCHSSDSCPEADHPNNFYEGPFLRMLFTRLSQLPYQSYQINLRLTGLISQLAMLPHPQLHEYLLNPMLPVIKGARTLFKVLHQVAEEIIPKVSEVDEHKAILLSTKIFLLQDKEYIADENSTLFEAFIVLEEFCKELASIVFVKYQNFC